MLATLLCFTVMAVAVKQLALHLSTAEILFFRSLIGLFIVTIIISRSGLQQLKTDFFKQHLIRNCAHFLGQYGWVYGIAMIPLAEVFALEFTVPIWTAFFASLILHEALTRRRIIAILLGFIGVLVILRPGFHIINPAVFAVLAGALCYGLSHTVTRKLIQTETPLTIVFYMTLIQLPIGFVVSFENWIMPSGIMWLWLILVALTALIAHYCLAKALTLADAVIVIPMDFLRLPVIMIVGYFIYNEALIWTLFAGALIMLAANFINIQHESNAITKNV